MGKIRDEALGKEAKKYTLNDGEYAFLERLVLLRNQSNTAFNTLASSFLSYVAGTRLGLSGDLQFEVDFETGSKEVKISQLPKKEK